MYMNYVASKHYLRYPYGEYDAAVTYRKMSYAFFDEYIFRSLNRPKYIGKRRIMRCIEMRYLLINNIVMF